eukprot:3222597-Rhodomonas_salina.1
MSWAWPQVSEHAHFLFTSFIGWMVGILELRVCEQDGGDETSENQTVGERLEVLLMLTLRIVCQIVSRRKSE